MRFAFLLAFSAIALASLVLAASFPPDAVVITVGDQVDKQVTGASEGKPLPVASIAPAPSKGTTSTPTVRPAQVSQLGRALSQVCAPNLAERIVKYSKEAVASARKKGSSAPSAEELAIMSAAMVMTEHQARRGESLGVCGDSSTRLSPTSDCGAFQISMRGGSIYPGKTRRQAYNANSDRNSADYALSCFNPDNNVREGVYAVLGAWQAYRRNPSAYSARAGGPAELGNVGLIYNKGAGGAKGGGDPNNYYARFIANYNHVEKLAG